MPIHATDPTKVRRNRVPASPAPSAHGGLLPRDLAQRGQPRFCPER